MFSKVIVKIFCHFAKAFTQLFQTGHMHLMHGSGLTVNFQTDLKIHVRTNSEGVNGTYWSHSNKITYVVLLFSSKTIQPAKKKYA